MAPQMRERPGQSVATVPRVPSAPTNPRAARDSCAGLVQADAVHQPAMRRRSSAASETRWSARAVASFPPVSPGRGEDPFEIDPTRSDSVGSGPPPQPVRHVFQRNASGSGRSAAGRETFDQGRPRRRRQPGRSDRRCARRGRFGRGPRSGPAVRPDSGLRPDRLPGADRKGLPYFAEEAFNAMSALGERLGPAFGALHQLGEHARRSVSELTSDGVGQRLTRSEPAGVSTTLLTLARLRGLQVDDRRRTRPVVWREHPGAPAGCLVSRRQRRPPVGQGVCLAHRPVKLRGRCGEATGPSAHARGSSAATGTVPGS